MDKEAEKGMSELETVAKVFYAPSEVFSTFVARPRFLLAWALVIICAASVNYLVISKVGFENIIRAQIESNSRTADLSIEQKQQIIDTQTSPVVTGIAYVSPAVAILVLFALGGAYYWLGSNAMGATTNFMQGLSVWLYSSLPPTVVLSLANIVVILLKSADDLSPSAFERGLVNVSPAMFLGGDASKPVAALLAAVDLFSIWGWVLAAIGLQRTAKLSAAASWGVVLLLALLGTAARVVFSLF